VLVIVCAGVVLASLDLFIVNVALPQMARDLGAGSISDLSWVLNAYAIVYASLLVLFGRLADRFPRERGFLLGVAVFVAASAACGAATSVPMLVAFRIVQAAGAALLTPTSLGLVLATAPAERRQSSVRIWTATGGVSASLGPVIGGLLVAASWRWVFFVNVPIGLAALWAGWRRLPVVPGHVIPRPDALGALLITGGVGALTLGLVKGGSWGWGSAPTVAVLALSVAALLLFALHTARARNPMIDRSLLRIRSFTGASLVALLFSVAFGALLLSIVLWEQNVWHWSALHAGLAIAPGPLMVPLFGFVIAGPLIVRYGAGRVIAAGQLLFGVGLILWALDAHATPNYASGILPGMILTGVGVGLTLPTMMAAAASALPPSSFATGSAVVNMFRQVGLAIGVAVLIAVVGTPGSRAAALAAFQRGWVVAAAFSLAAAVLAPLLLSSRRRAAAGASESAPAPGASEAAPAPVTSVTSS
jgi:EmrB/QacA subfamily drug resistance transporter